VTLLPGNGLGEELVLVSDGRIFIAEVPARF